MVVLRGSGRAEGGLFCREYYYVVRQLLSVARLLFVFSCFIISFGRPTVTSLHQVCLMSLSHLEARPNAKPKPTLKYPFCLTIVARNTVNVNRDVTCGPKLMT